VALLGENNSVSLQKQRTLISSHAVHDINIFLLTKKNLTPFSSMGLIYCVLFGNLIRDMGAYAPTIGKGHF
jgi:hypothetical protein